MVFENIKREKMKIYNKNNRAKNKLARLYSPLA